MKLYLAKHRGFCSGVKRSIRMAQKVLDDASKPVHILNDIVHNQTVINELKNAGLISVRDINEVNDGTIIFSAHGVPKAIENEARSLNLKVIDTTCPLVKRIHKTAQDFIIMGYEVILFGDPEHDEVKGIKGVGTEHIHVIKTEDEISELPDFKKLVALIAQSTSSVNQFNKIAGILKRRYTSFKAVNTICRATRLRQESIHQLAEIVDIVIVIGSSSSANSNRLVEIARSYDKKAYLIDNAGELKFRWLIGAEKVGVTSGASTPDFLVQELLHGIQHYFREKRIPVELFEV